MENSRGHIRFRTRQCTKYPSSRCSNWGRPRRHRPRSYSHHTPDCPWQHTPLGAAGTGPTPRRTRRLNCRSRKRSRPGPGHTPCPRTGASSRGPRPNRFHRQDSGHMGHCTLLSKANQGDKLPGRNRCRRPRDRHLRGPPNLRPDRSHNSRRDSSHRTQTRQCSRRSRGHHPDNRGFVRAGRSNRPRQCQCILPASRAQGDPCMRTIPVRSRQSGQGAGERGRKRNRYSPQYSSYTLQTNRSHGTGTRAWGQGRWRTVERVVRGFWNLSGTSPYTPGS